MKFQCFTHWDQLPENSDRLFTRGEKDSLFFSRNWFESLSKTNLRSGQSLLLACVIHDDALQAILPLIKCSNDHWLCLHHIMHSSLYTLLLAKGDQTQAIKCLAKGLSQQTFNTLSLEPIAENDKAIHQLRQEMTDLGLSSNRYLRFDNWYYPLKEQIFSDYMAERPSQLRNTIKRKQRKLKREQHYQIRLYTDTNLELALRDYHSVYQASWKPKETNKAVIDEITSSFSKRGWTRLAILYINNQPVATQLWFVVHQKASIFKLAYDEAWKQYSPGSILTQYLMEYVIDTDKVKEIDFLTGNDRYKRDWMSKKRRRWKLVFTQTPPKEIETDKQKDRSVTKRLKAWLKRV